jgi:hypothetical protein
MRNTLTATVVVNWRNIAITLNDSFAPPSAPPFRPHAARTLVARGYSLVNSVYSFVTGWPRFSALPHYPHLSLTPFLPSP